MLAGMSDDAARFRTQAEEAREHAARVASPLDKEAWLRIAEEWLKFSESAENQAPDIAPPQLASRFPR
jgi:hypothetical protein